MRGCVVWARVCVGSCCSGHPGSSVLLFLYCDWLTAGQRLPCFSGCEVVIVPRTPLRLSHGIPPLLGLMVIASLLPYT